VVERCRYCNRPLQADSPEHHKHWPFCSSRCRLAELGHWLEGRYVISRNLDEVADDAALPGADTPRETRDSNGRSPKT